MAEYKMKTVRQESELNRDSITALETQHPRLKLLNDATLDKPRGFTIRRDEIAAAIGTDDDKEIAATIKLWKRCVLWLRGIDVKYCGSKTGYRFLEVEVHLTTEYDKRQAAIERKEKHEATKLMLMRSEDMTEHQQRLRLALANSCNDAAGKINSQRSMAAIWQRQPDTLPRINGK